ncbi:MAG: hypothetical protein ACKV2Q_02035 [Planctomycetaceae bacterium]
MTDINRFSSRRQRLDHAFLNVRLKDAQSYKRIAVWWQFQYTAGLGMKFQPALVLLLWQLGVALRAGRYGLRFRSVQRLADCFPPHSPKGHRRRCGKLATNLQFTQRALPTFLDLMEK